ncbi:hypothetical protein BGX20_010641 [Mortierella sp. AD010]|nr:hypothetical protein BGX20_010641 [Mortierella sp. AD010]
MGMLRACPSLSHLTLEASEETKRFEADQINLITTNTGTLEGQGEGEEGEEGEEEESESHSPDKPSKKSKSSTNKLPRPSPPEFIHLSLEHLHFIGNLIPSFLQYVPNIKSLKLTTILYGDFQDLEHQLQMVAQTKQIQSTETTETAETPQCLSQITHLYTFTKCQNPSQYMSLINAIPTPNHLVHFEGQVPARIARRFLEIMVEQQSESIERLIVIPGSNTEFQEQEYSPLGFEFNIWRILERCPQLTVLEIPYFLGYASIYITSRLKPVLHGDGSEAGIECVDIVRKVYEPIQEWVCKDLRRLYLRIKDMDRMNPMEQITFDLCVDRLVPPEERQEGDAHRKTLTTRSALERMVLHKLSGLQKLEELNIGSGWYTLPAWTHPRHHHH